MNSVKNVANVTPSGPAAWKTIPSWAVLGTEDRVIPIETKRRMAARAGSTVTEVDASHVSMISHPDVTLDAVLLALLFGQTADRRPGFLLEEDHLVRFLEGA